MYTYTYNSETGRIYLTGNDNFNITSNGSYSYDVTKEFEWLKREICKSESACNIDKKYIPKPFTCKSLL